MTVEIDRLHPPSHYEPLGGTKMTSYVPRLPLQPRQQLHVANGNTGSSSSSGGDENCTSSRDMNVFNRMSTLESSNNENNKRISSFSSRHRRNKSMSQQEKDSSTIAQTGAPASSMVSRSPAEVITTPAEPLVRSSSAQRPTQRSSFSSNNKMEDNGEESVMIEEKRRRVNGEGYTIHRYLRGRLLGRGGFAKVYLCTALDTNKNYAVKIVPKANLVKARARQKLQAEIKIHRTLKHKHICEYKHFFEDRQNCYILLELCHNQSLNEMIKRRKRLTEQEAAYFMRQLLDSVRYLHESFVIHRDLKLGNLFLDKNLNIKVGDLGLATRLETLDEKRKTICGTPNYIAPEVIQGDKKSRGHSFEVDIWSMGVVLFTILVGKPPYEAKDVKATYQRIIANEYSFPSHLDISDNAKNLIISMLQTKPEDRPSLDQIGAHPFLVDTSVPMCLPLNATHTAPDWRLNGFGELVLAQKYDDNDIPSRMTKKASLPRSSGRRPLVTRDPNIDAGSERDLKKEKSDRDVIDVHGIVRNAMGCTAGSKQTLSSSKNNAPSPGFQIFDENETRTSQDHHPWRTHSKPHPPRPSPSADDVLVGQTNALSVRANKVNTPIPTPPITPALGPTPTASAPPPAPVQACSSTPLPLPAAHHHAAEEGTALQANSGSDTQVLRQMLERIETVMETTNSRKSNYHSYTPRVLQNGGPSKWVTRYVDYTSKYGLGFLLNDGSSGVYFNDATKTVLEAQGETFQYVERKKEENDVTANWAKKYEALVSIHTLSSYPDTLQKKVTLLKHFRNYLVEQQKKSEEEDFMKLDTENEPHSQGNLVFVRKWIRTKHAILFRLSDQTVQIVFYDQTEILLTPDERYITYVNKARNRLTYNFNDELLGSIPDLAKRLKYTKDILQQLLSGQRR